MADQICYSAKYFDDEHEYRYGQHRVRPFAHTRKRCELASSAPFPLPFFPLVVPCPCPRSEMPPALDPALPHHRHVILPKSIAKRVPKDRLLSETEWRNIGVQQSRGWIHYMHHRPGENLRLAAPSPFHLHHHHHGRGPSLANACHTAGQWAGFPRTCGFEAHVRVLTPTTQNRTS